MKNILNEASEFFGRFQMDDGSFISFQNRVEMNSGKKFQELSDEYKEETSQSNSFFTGPVVSSFNYRRFYGWQKNIIGLLEKNNDVYVVAPPGGGKTTPLMAYWFVNILCRGKNGDMDLSFSPRNILKNNLDRNLVKRWSDIFSAILTLNYSNGQRAPAVLFITPIRVLSFEQAESFQELFIDLLIFLKSLFLNLPNDFFKKNREEKMLFLKTETTNQSQILYEVFSKINSSRIFDLFSASPEDSGLQNEYESWVRNHTLSLISVKTGGGGEQYNSNPKNTLVTIATYGSAKNFINEISQIVKFIVYDEAQTNINVLLKK